jgi:hypothetical protein
MTRSYFVALGFIRDDGDIVPGDAFECPNAMDAALQAQVLSHAAGNIGAVAYSRTANDVGVFSEAVIIKKFGDAPSDLKNQAPVSRGPILYGARRTSGRAAIVVSYCHGRCCSVASRPDFIRSFHLNGDLLGAIA